MKKIKFTFLILASIVTFSATSHAVEVSLGFGLGAGLPFMRGELYDTLKAQNGSTGLNFSGNTHLDLMIEVLPFLAIETGFGLSASYFSYGAGEYSDEMMTEAMFIRSHAYIPIMLRGQYEYELGVTYIAVGVKMDITALSAGQVFFDNFNSGSLSVLGDFSMDMSFAIGQEFRLGDANYLGLRLGYDLNVISPYDMSDNAGDIFMDGLNLELTYRYAFMSKWK